MRGLFVTGTDTGVGKTVLTAAIAAALRARGEAVAAHKPVLTGTAERAPAGAGAGWPPDHVLLAACTGQAADAVGPVRFGPPVSPHLAAQLAGATLDVDALAAVAREAAAGADALLVEGVGGLLVPLAGPRTVRDLAAAVGLPLVIAARPGLGTLNHSLLTVEAARGAGLTVAGIVLGPWPERPSTIERSNAATLAQLTGVEVATLPHLAAPDPALLARAGAGLPLARWLGAPAGSLAA